jgi:hypothetical protein
MLARPPDHYMAAPAFCFRFFLKCLPELYIRARPKLSVTKSPDVEMSVHECIDKLLSREEKLVGLYYTKYTARTYIPFRMSGT